MKRYAAQTGRLCQGRSEGFSPEGRQGVRETDPVGWAHRAAFLGEVGSTKVDEDSVHWVWGLSKWTKVASGVSGEVR